MKVKMFSAMVFGALALAASTVAKAEDAPAAPADPAAPAAPADPAAAPPPVATAAAPAATAGAASSLRVGFNLVPMPIGSIKTNALGTDSSFDTSPAFGVMGVIDYHIVPNFFIGFSPSFALNVKGKDASESAKELDLMVRIGGAVPVSEKLQIFGYLAPGYSIIMPPNGDSPKGLIGGLHLGAMVDITPAMYFSGQVGYQMGFQKVSAGGTDVDLKTNFLQIGLGLGWHV